MRLTNRSTFWLVLVVVAVTLAGGAYAAPQTSDRTAAKRTIHLREASPTPKLKVVDIGDPGVSAGDHVVTVDGVLDEHGDRAGSMSQVCTILSPGENVFTSTYDCSGSFDLADGSITVQGTFVPTAESSTLAITGGTGRFAKARGEVVLATEADTITIDLA